MHLTRITDNRYLPGILHMEAHGLHTGEFYGTSLREIKTFSSWYGRSLLLHGLALPQSSNTLSVGVVLGISTSDRSSDLFEHLVLLIPDRKADAA